MVDGLTSIIVPAWRGGSSSPVAALIESVPASMHGSWELIVVCNGADRTLVDYIRGSQTVTRAAFLSQNAGVARAWNIGAHLALGEFVVFANEDLVLGPQSTQKLVDALAGDHSIGVVGPRGSLWTITRSAARHMEYVSGPGLVDCDVVSGFLFGMRRDVLQRAGYFDDTLAPCSYEEVDIGLAVRAAGFRLCALSGLAFEHDWGVSAWNPDRRIEWMGRDESIEDINLRNHAHVLRKWKEAVRAIDDVQDESSSAAFVGKTIEAIDAAALLSPGARVLYIGSAPAVAVGELGRRGYDASAVEAEPQGAVVELTGVNAQGPIDIVIANHVYEGLTDPEARILSRRLAVLSNTLIVTFHDGVRRSPTTASWLRLFNECGYRRVRSATSQIRSDEDMSLDATGRQTSLWLLRRSTPSAGLVRRVFGGRLSLRSLGRTLGRMFHLE